MKAKDMSKTVEGKTYKEVIHVEARTTIVFTGMEMGSGVTANYFWAKGIGLVLSDLGQYGNVPLMTYTIK